MSNIKALRQRKADFIKKQRALLDKAAAEDNRAMTESESSEYEANIKVLTQVEASLEREEHVLQLERDNGNVTIINDDNPTGTAVVEQKQFKTLGEFMVAVVRAERSHGRQLDPRLIQAAASGASEAVPSDGGFLVQKDFSAELLKRTYATGQITQRVRRIPIGDNANGVRINAIDEDSRVDGSRFGGVLSYWINEADAFTSSKPKFRQVELQLQKLIGLCYATDELLQDSAALEAVIMEAFPQEITFKVEDAIFNGTGSGQPLGILNSAAVIQAAAASGSGVRIGTTDILTMWGRLWAPSRANAVWFINQDLEPLLYPLTLGSGTAVTMLYTPPGGPNNLQYGMLQGRPVIPVEHCATAGTPGDIILADLQQYLMIDKGAPQSASSIHVRFLNDETTFRFVYRCDGQPWWKKPLTPKNGSNTLSPFIDLAVRS